MYKRYGCKVIEPSGEHKYTLIFMHGFTGAPMFYMPMWTGPHKWQPANCRIVMPDSGYRYVKGLNSKQKSWFDFHGNYNTPSYEAFTKNFNR